MAINPIIHDSHGIHRFQDYLSNLPGFLKGEEDVVVLMQLFSDYINNAYRNTTIVKKFEFKLVSVESRVGETVTVLQKLADLFKQTEKRNGKIVFLSKPIATPIGSNEIFLGKFDYDGTLANLSPSIINFTLTGKDGSRVFVRFTNSEEEENTGVYVYNEKDDTLTLDPFGTSQDPFTNTPNEPIATIGGLSPRMVEFSPSNISSVRVRKAQTIGTTIYFETFFSAMITDIDDVESIIAVDKDVDGDGEIDTDDRDYRYLIDYYNVIDTLPSRYRYKYAVDFVEGCKEFDWFDRSTQGYGLFYAKDLTQYKHETTELNREGNNFYIDPAYDNNIREINISSILGDGSTVTVVTKSAHELGVGDVINIEGATSSYNDTEIVVVSVINVKSFTYAASGTDNVNSGRVVVTNLFYGRKINSTRKFLLKIPYENKEGSVEFATGDTIMRIEDSHPKVAISFLGNRVDLKRDLIKKKRAIERFVVGDKVTLRENIPFVDGGGTVVFPTGLEEGLVYEIDHFTSDGQKFKLKDTDIQAAGSGKIEITKLNLYFDASATDVSLSTDEITIHHAVSGTDPLEDIAVGDSIRLRGVSGSITLPTPLTMTDKYYVLERNTVTKTIKLSLDGTNVVNLTGVGNGIIDVLKISRVLSDTGKIQNVEINGTSGEITLEYQVGDFISEGQIAKYSNGEIDFRADIVSTSVKWENTIGKKYKKGTYVTYKNNRYLLLKSVTISENVKTPDLDTERYLRSMDELTLPIRVRKDNPYMFGMYRTKPLEFNEEIPFRDGFNELALDLYVQKVEDLELRYGHDQREWVFNQRLSPKEIVNRNGYLEVITDSTLTDDAGDYPDIVDGDVSLFTKAKSSYGMILEGTVLEIEKTVSSLTYNSTTEVVTAVTSDDHRIRSGVRVDISGATPSEYNGRVQITVVDATTFTYSPITEPTVASASGTIEFRFRNVAENEIQKAENIGTDFVFTTFEHHGLRDGSYVTVENTLNGYDGTFGPIVVDSSTQFTVPANTTSLLVEEYSSIDAPIVIYQPQDGDYINLENQYLSGENAIYTANDSKWLRYDNTRVAESTILFARQNFFDVTDNNPTIAKGASYGISDITRIGNEVTVQLYESHNYSTETVVNISNIQQNEYNGRFKISSIISPRTFTYYIKVDDEPATPGTHRGQNKKMTCQSDKWYKYTLNNIEWQQKSNSLTYTAGTDGREYFFESDGTNTFTNNIFSLEGEYKYTFTQVLTSIDETEDTFRFPTVTNYSVGDELIFNANEDSITGMVNGQTYTIKEVFPSPAVSPETRFNKITLNDPDGNQVTFTSAQIVSTSTFTQIQASFLEGDIVNVADQFIATENGKYRVQKGEWRRLDRRWIAKVRDISVDSVMLENPLEMDTQDPMLYRTYTTNEVNEFTEENFSGNLQVYRIDNLLAGNFNFRFEKVESIDTTKSYHKVYDAKFDKNSVTDTSDMGDFVGITDMKYPLIEKIERLVYLKDPNVIDFEFISKLARYMGYDMTGLLDDVTESVFYKTQDERENALRKTIQNLPQFNSLKSTAGGLESILLTFGIVAKVVTLWTEDAHPYDEFIPDYMVRNIQNSKMVVGENANMVPTPHFKLTVNVDGNFDNQLDEKEIQQIESTVERYKPINTVFDGLIAFLEATLNTTIWISDMNGTGRMQADIGFEDIEFDAGERINNDCI